MTDFTSLLGYLLSAVMIHLSYNVCLDETGNGHFVYGSLANKSLAITDFKR